MTEKSKEWIEFLKDLFKNVQEITEESKENVPPKDYYDDHSHDPEKRFYSLEDM